MPWSHVTVAGEAGRSHLFGPVGGPDSVGLVTVGAQRRGEMFPVAPRPVATLLESAEDFTVALPAGQARKLGHRLGLPDTVKAVAIGADGGGVVPLSQKRAVDAVLVT